MAVSKCHLETCCGYPGKACLAKLLTVALALLLSGGVEPPADHSEFVVGFQGDFPCEGKNYDAAVDAGILSVHSSVGADAGLSADADDFAVAAAVAYYVAAAAAVVDDRDGVAAVANVAV